jgi:3-oxoacyl-[acyl-carrier protein] reductase
MDLQLRDRIVLVTGFAQYPLRRVGRPDDVTPMILLLASPLSSWTTGQVIAVNGGYAMV